MIEYGDTYRIEIWNRLYPVSHPRKDWGGKCLDQQNIQREQAKQIVLNYMDNPETVAINIHREEK